MLNKIKWWAIRNWMVNFDDLNCVRLTYLSNHKGGTAIVSLDGEGYVSLGNYWYRKITK